MAQAARVDGEHVDVVTVVLVLHSTASEIDMPRRPEQFEEIVLRITPRRMGELIGERAYREGVWDVEHGPKPADAHVRDSLTILATDVRNGIRHIDDALTELAITRVRDVRLERRWNGREYGSMKPRDCVALTIERSFQMLRTDGVAIVMLNIVLPRPRYLDWRGDRSR